MACLLGKLVSLLVIIVFWKPFYLFNQGFHAAYWDYWKRALLFIAINLASIFLSTSLISIPDMQTTLYSGFPGWFGGGGRRNSCLHRHSGFSYVPASRFIPQPFIPFS